jgi:hypothetical protein
MHDPAGRRPENPRVLNLVFSDAINQAAEIIKEEDDDAEALDVMVASMKKMLAMLRSRG